MMQVAADKIIHMIAVRYSLVAAPWAVDMCCFVLAAVVPRRALVWIFGGHRDAVIIDMAVMHVMQMSIVQVIGVAVVCHGCVSAALAVDVGVVFVFHARSSHLIPPATIRVKSADSSQS
jgi:hypothetical protein